MNLTSDSLSVIAHPPRLTVVICTYNNADVLAQTLAHLEAQCTDERLEFDTLVIDNNCRDHTPAVIAAARERGRLRHLHHFVETRQGQVFARVRGVMESRTEWIAFVDDDNLLQPGWIQGALAFVTAHPGCGAFGGRIQIEWEAPPTPTIERHNYAYARLDLGRVAKKLEGEARWHLRGAGLVCRKQALVASGWLDWQVCVGRVGGVTTSGDDLEMVMRIAREGYEIWYEPACHMRHLISASRISQHYLEKLHFGFGLAEPILRGLKKRQSFAAWLGDLLLGFVQRFGKAVKLYTVAVFRRQERERARVHWAYFRGMLTGLRPALRLRPEVRRGWLGQNSSGGAPLLRTPASV